MKKVMVLLSNEKELYFVKNGDPPAVYDIVNWQLSSENTVNQVTVGNYDTTSSIGQPFTINSSLLLWATEDNQV